MVQEKRPDDPPDAQSTGERAVPAFRCERLRPDLPGGRRIEDRQSGRVLEQAFDASAPAGLRGLDLFGGLEVGRAIDDVGRQHVHARIVQRAPGHRIEQVLDRAMLSRLGAAQAADLAAELLRASPGEQCERIAELLRRFSLLLEIVKVSQSVSLDARSARSGSRSESTWSCAMVARDSSMTASFQAFSFLRK